MAIEIRNPGTHPSLEDLRSIPVFKDLEDEHLRWLADRLSNETFESGEIIVRQGDIPDYMTVIFEGELHAHRTVAGRDSSLYMARAPMVTGKLPYSRMKEFPSTVKVFGRTRLGRLHDSHFPEMLRTIPSIGEILVGVLSDRIRESTKVDVTHEKLAALGKLSAGLAHELNNPASAAKRAAVSLRECLKQLADANRALAGCKLTDEQRELLARHEEDKIARLDSMPVLDTLALSDREQELLDWFEQNGIGDGWELAAVFAEMGVSPNKLDEVLAVIGKQVMEPAMRRGVATFNAERLLRSIENSMDRISNLVKAVKEYSYMDQSAFQEIDLNRSLDTTLTVMNFRLKNCIKVVREYDSSLPSVCANGSELNTVWTNLIDNAVDAMNGKGELRIRTVRENDFVLVEIVDSGSGIPPEIQSRIFDPFFTTKGVGRGTGLGLEFVYRIVARHRGDVRVNSKPGHTSFAIRLPLAQPPVNPAHLEQHEEQDYEVLVPQSVR